MDAVYACANQAAPRWREPVRRLQLLVDELVDVDPAIDALRSIDAPACETLHLAQREESASIPTKTQIDRFAAAAAPLAGEELICTNVTYAVAMARHAGASVKAFTLIYDAGLLAALEPRLEGPVKLTLFVVTPMDEEDVAALERMVERDRLSTLELWSLRTPNVTRVPFVLRVPTLVLGTVALDDAVALFAEATPNAGLQELRIQLNAWSADEAGARMEALGTSLGRWPSLALVTVTAPLHQETHLRAEDYARFAAALRSNGRTAVYVPPTNVPPPTLATRWLKRMAGVARWLLF